MGPLWDATASWQPTKSFGCRWVAFRSEGLTPTTSSTATALLTTPAALWLCIERCAVLLLSGYAAAACPAGAEPALPPLLAAFTVGCQLPCALSCARRCSMQIHLFNVDVPGGPVLMESRCAAACMGGTFFAALECGPSAPMPPTHQSARVHPCTHPCVWSPDMHAPTHRRPILPPPRCRFTTAGDRLMVCDSPAGRLGISICYDLRFPELYQRLAWDLGAQVLLVPSAFTVATGGCVGVWVDE